MIFYPPASSEPQELEILGSITTDVWIYFNFSKLEKYNRNSDPYYKTTQDDTPSHLSFRNSSLWHNLTVALKVSVYHAPSDSLPWKLPWGILLICDDCAWPALSLRAIGGSHTIGHLTMLTSNLTMIINHTHKADQEWHKHALNEFTKVCDPSAQFWNPLLVRVASIFAPRVAAAKALTIWQKIGCWLAQQTNATSLALSGLLTDVDSVHHATLQSHAAIDFFAVSPWSCMSRFLKNVLYEFTLKPYILVFRSWKKVLGNCSGMTKQTG